MIAFAVGHTRIDRTQQSRQQQNKSEGQDKRGADFWNNFGSCGSSEQLSAGQPGKRAHRGLPICRESQARLGAKIERDSRKTVSRNHMAKAKVKVPRFLGMASLEIHGIFWRGISIARSDGGMGK